MHNLHLKFFVVVTILIIMLGCGGGVKSDQYYRQFVNERFGLNLSSDMRVVTKVDSFGGNSVIGNVGDGHIFVVFEIGETAKEFEDLLEKKRWKSLPLPPELAQGDGADLLKSLGMPIEAQNGLFLFVDRNTTIHDKDKAWYDRPGITFKFGLYDSQTLRFYYLSLTT